MHGALTSDTSDSPPQVLVVDDEPGLRQVLSIALRRAGLHAVTASGVGAALKALDEDYYALVITDMMMPDGSGMDVLRHVLANCPETEVVMMTAYSTVDLALDAMRQGAYDFLKKPFSPAEVAELAKKAVEKSGIVAENQRLKARLHTLLPDKEDVSPFGDSAAMQKVTALVEKAARTKTTVLITGESGTGKERVARYLHDRSIRADENFSVINCGALPEQLMESELFGHEKGAFTGASASALGLFRQADGGTLFLDEVGELPLSLQVKLLRALQERKVRPVGGSTEIPVDVRVVAATNRDVEQDVEAGTFRQDLYYRLNVIRVALPPLRDRSSDIRRIANEMMGRFCRDFEKPPMTISGEVLTCLEAYDFPGNIRELENIIERAVALSATNRLELEDLPPALAGGATAAPPVVATIPPAGVDLNAVLEDTERRYLEAALKRTDGVRKDAAEILGMTFRSFRYRLKKLGVDRSDVDDESVDDD